MSPKSAALRNQDSTGLPGSNPAVSDSGEAPAPERPAHLSLVPPIVDETPAGGTPRRRRWITSAASVVVVVGVIIGLAVLPGDTQAPAQADRDPQPPTHPAGDAQRQPTAPATTAPDDPAPQAEPPAEDEPGSPVAPPTGESPAPTGSETADPAPPSGGADTGEGPGSPPVAPPGTQAPADPSPPPTSPPATSPPATTPPPVTADGAVNGCNTYGENCGDNPLYVEVPPQGYDYTSFPTVTTVANGTTLTARCWTRGGVTYNYAAWFDPPDYGPNPYESDVVFNVRVPGSDQWAWIPDTWFVRDKGGRMGLPEC